MGDVPTPVNEPAVIVNGIIQFAIYDVAVNALQVAAIAELPWLGWPVIKQLFGLLLNTIAGYIYKYLAQAATFEIIDLQTEAEQSAYAAAVGKLQTAISTGDQDATTQGIDEFKKSLGSLIHFDGSAPTTSRFRRFVSRLFRKS